MTDKHMDGILSPVASWFAQAAEERASKGQPEKQETRVYGMDQLLKALKSGPCAPSAV